MIYATLLLVQLLLQLLLVSSPVQESTLWLDLCCISSARPSLSCPALSCLVLCLFRVFNSSFTHTHTHLFFFFFSPKFFFFLGIFLASPFYFPSFDTNTHFIDFYNTLEQYQTFIRFSSIKRVLYMFLETFLLVFSSWFWLYLLFSRVLLTDPSKASIYTNHVCEKQCISDAFCI